MTNSTSITEVDGIPVLLTATSGPMRAGLVFRVGRADESLPTAGITHLVEHLALHRQGAANYHYNGTTSTTTTQFLIQGTAEAVVAFLNDVCASLRDLPINRLADEKKIIQTEAANRPTSVDHLLPLWRHGAQDFGLVSYPEWGMHTLTPKQVTDWAANRFNRGNAVLWIAGEQIPAGLKLDLPDGKRWALPAESSALQILPSYFTDSAPMVVLGAQVPRTAPATLYVRALERALFRELRQHRGLSYTAAAAYSTDGRQHATVTAIADAQPDALDSVVTHFLAEVHKLHDHDIDPAQLDAIRTLELEKAATADVEADLLPRRANDLLTGFPLRTTAELLQGLRETSVGDLRQIAHAVKKSSLLMVPDGLARPPAGYEPAPSFSRYSVTGKQHRSRADHQVILIHGPEGVSLSMPLGPSTVPFESCAALLRFPDGARHLIGIDGIGVRIEPTLFAITSAALTQIDNAVGPTAIVDMPPRVPSTIPRPSRITATRSRLRRLTLPWRARLNRLVALQGGMRSLLISTALGLATVATGTLALALGGPYLGGTLVFIAILIWRRRNLGHW